MTKLRSLKPKLKPAVMFCYGFCAELIMNKTFVLRILNYETFTYTQFFYICLQATLGLIKIGKWKPKKKKQISILFYLFYFAYILKF